MPERTVWYPTDPNQRFLFPPPEPFGPPPVLVPPAPAGRWTPRATVIALTAVACVLLATAGLFCALFVMAGNNRAAAAQQLDQRRGQLADANGQLASAQADQQQAEQRNSTLASQNAALSKCVTAMQHYLWDGLTGDQRDAALNAMFQECQ